ncbi:MAG: flippase [Gemmatimonadales bacterium]|nr:flippase [Gemmatimonadales bacterium]
MGASRSVAKNTFLLTIGLLSGRALGLVLIKKMTPILGTDGIGIWVTATDLTAILSVVANFGLSTLLTREITRAPVLTLPLFWATLRIRWLIGSACYLFLLGFVHVSGYTELARAAALLTGLAIFIESTSMACDSVLQAHEKVQYQSIGQMVSAVVYFGLGWIWLEAGHGLMGVIWANVVSRIVRLLVMAPLMFWKTGPWRWRDPDGAIPPDLRWILKLGLPIFLSSTFGIIYNKVDTIMIKGILGDSSAGIYGLGHRALDMMVIVPNLFGTALFPVMARYGLRSPSDAVRLGERALRFMLILMLPLTLFLTFVAGPIIHWFDPNREFPDSIPVLMIVIWGLPLYASTIIFNRLLITANRERAFVVISLVSMLANIVLNSLLIPRYSYFGASWATIASVSLSFVLHVRYLAATDYKLPLLRALAGPGVAMLMAWGATVALIGFALPDWGISWFGLPLDRGWGPFLGSVGVMAVMYALAIAGLRVVRGKDLELLRELGG